jgi:hypothetical protein
MAIAGSAHYKKGKIEPWEVIEDWGLDFHLGNVIKYIGRHHAVRARKKREDLLKAIHYLVRFALREDPTLRAEIRAYIAEEIGEEA